MSRNLGRIDCYFCEGRVKLVGKVHPIMREECGGYFSEYDGMLVADAECSDCEAKYLAWVDESTRVSGGWNRGRDEREFVDLSFRSTFDDEAGAADMPRWEIHVVRQRARPWPYREWISYCTRQEAKP
jgi:hypothetical protein